MEKTIKIILCVVVALLTIAIVGTLAGQLSLKALGAADGFSRGVSDANCDFNRCHGHGFDNTCPRNHSNAFCINYVNGYNTEWNKLTRGNIAIAPHGSASASSSSSASSSGGNSAADSSSSAKSCLAFC